MLVKIVDDKSADEIAKLAVCLTNEIIERTGIKHFVVDVPLATQLCKSYMKNGQYTVVAAYKKGEIIGFGTLCESHSLYAEGAFGIIQEFYVMPKYRSHTIGQQLIERIVSLAKDNGWKRLELCTPPVPEFNRTVAFYQANNFEITGGYKMKRVIA